MSNQKKQNKNSKSNEERENMMNNTKKETVINAVINTHEGGYTVNVKKAGERFHCQISPLTNNRFQHAYVNYFKNTTDIYANAFELSTLGFSEMESCELAREIEMESMPGDNCSMNHLLEAIDQYQSDLCAACDCNADEEYQNTPQERLDELNDIIDYLYDEAQKLLDGMRSFRREIGVQE